MRFQIQYIFVAAAWVVAAMLITPTAQAQRAPKEMAGAKDHALVSRYAGSTLQDMGSINYAEITIPAGPGKIVNNQVVYDKPEKASGKLSNYFYIHPKERSALEVFKNYAQALSGNGFSVLYSCEDVKQCDAAFITSRYRGELLSQLKWQSNSNQAASATERDIRFLTAKKTAGSNTTYVVLFVAEPDSVWQAATTALVVVEAAAMATGQVVINDAAMKSDLSATGKVALYGIYFDTGKAEIKAESKAQLDEMAKLLNGAPQMNVYIVGHTDNEGSLDGNANLSQRRAEAVSAALVNSYKIAAKRLSAKGVASLSPVAANGTPEGRAKNRRVELVVQ